MATIPFGRLPGAAVALEEFRVIAAATGSHASDSAEQPAHCLPQDVDAERLDHHPRLRGPDELLVGAAIGVARDEQNAGRGGGRRSIAR